MNVLSLFDGISCARLAMNRINLPVTKYYASEIKDTAKKVVSYNFPDTVQLGDIRGVNSDSLNDSIDILFAGFPCKGISKLNQKQQGLSHKETILFYEALRIKNEFNPKTFLFECTHGNKEAVEVVTDLLGVKPISINSKLLTAQNRPRYYWTNIQGIEQPKDLGLTSMTLANHFKQRIKGALVPENRVRWIKSESGQKSISKGYTKVNPFPKYGCITANGHKKWNENYLLIDDKYYYLNRFELEWLQSLPPGYTDILNYDDAYDVIGDCWTVSVISHILSYMIN